MNTVNQVWEPITDLNEDWILLRREDLSLVHAQWKQEKAILKDPEKIRALEERLATEWAVETGIMERLYTVDRGVTESLIELGLNTIDSFHKQGRITEHAMQLIEDQKDALEFVFQFVRQQRELTSGYIKELHLVLTRRQEETEAADQFGNRFMTALLKGAWKKLPNNPTRPDGLVHEYCPPLLVQDEIDQMLKWHGEHHAENIAVEVEAAWLHHRFTQIHPFQDGNGRVARALATLVFLRSDYLPLVLRDREHRESYLEALERADQGDLGSLVDLFAEIEINDMSKAIEFVRNLRGSGIGNIARSAAERAKIREQQTEEEVHKMTDNLLDVASDRLQEIQAELRQQFDRERILLDVDVGRWTPDIETWWTGNIVEIARGHGYWANLGKFRRWLQLRLRLTGVSTARSHVVVSFHHRDRTPGLMVANAFFTTSAADGSPESLETVSLASHPYSYSASQRDPETGFRKWLEQVIEAGLNEWQSRI